MLHLLSSLEVGGKERAAIRLAQKALEQGWSSSIFLFDAPYRGAPVDLDPGEVPWRFFRRRPGIDMKLAGAIARAARSAGAAVMHAHNETAIFYAIVARALLPGMRVRVVGTFHTRPSYPKASTRLAAAVAFRFADRIVAVSDEMARWLMTSRLVPRCGVVVNGVDLERFSPAARHAFKRSVVFVSLSRLAPVKRHADLIDAFERMHASCPDTLLTIHGTGPMEPEIRRRASGASASILVPGVASNARQALSEADVFVQCSDHEGTPLALLEAMAMALPVICTDVGGMPAVVGRSEAEGGCALLVPPRDTRALAAAMTMLASDAAMRARLGANARRRAARYAFEREWRLYRHLYAGSPSGRR